MPTNKSTENQTLVFTTTFVTDSRNPIVYVSHDADGDWQMHSADEFEDFSAVARVVSLENLLQFDPSIQKVLHMHPGYYAVRETADSEWHIVKRQA